MKWGALSPELGRSRGPVVLAASLSTQTAGRWVLFGLSLISTLQAQWEASDGEESRREVLLYLINFVFFFFSPLESLRYFFRVH